MHAAKRSGRPLAAASSDTDSDEVVVASTAWSESTPARRPYSSRFAPGSSAMASTTTLQVPSSESSVTTRAASWILAHARSADSALRAQSRTSWELAAVRARPHAIAPLPVIPRVSGIG